MRARSVQGAGDAAAARIVSLYPGHLFCHYGIQEPRYVDADLLPQIKLANVRIQSAQPRRRLS